MTLSRRLLPVLVIVAALLGIMLGVQIHEFLGG